MEKKNKKKKKLKKKKKKKKNIFFCLIFKKLFINKNIYIVTFFFVNKYIKIIMARKNKDKNVTEDLEHNQFSKAVDNLKKIYKVNKNNILIIN